MRNLLQNILESKDIFAYSFMITYILMLLITQNILISISSIIILPIVFMVKYNLDKNYRKNIKKLILKLKDKRI